MNYRKPLPIIFLIIVSLVVNNCEIERYGCTDPNALNYDVAADIDDDSCLPLYDSINSANCVSAEAGNLVINNQTGKTLLLYNNYNRITCIPSNAEYFLVNIPNNNLSICLLQIWISEDVEDLHDPDLNYVYRQWSVALSNTTLATERANWLITGDDDYAGSGTLLISYPRIDEFGMDVIYQVDVFLNSQSGAKLASLQPGISDKKVSVDFGVHYLYYHYWYSDPNSTSGDITDIGWEEYTEVVINEYHKEAEIDIPVFYSTVGKLGEVTIINESDFVVNVYANDKLIEDIAIVDGSTHGLSSVPAKDQSTFIIPVQNYSLVTRKIGGDQVSEFKNIDIVQNEKVVLHSGIAHRTIIISNNTTETLALYNEQEEYLGLVINPGKTSPDFKIPAMYDTLIVIDFAKTKTGSFGYNSVVSVDSLVDYEYNRIEFISPWPLVDGLYQSPEILDNEMTVMQATLINSETAVLTFDYNVSSEPTYDVFSFLVDDAYEILNAGGETGWVTFSMVVDAGTHSLKWVYSKDRSRPVGRDNVQLRKIQVE